MIADAWHHAMRTNQWYSGEIRLSSDFNMNSITFTEVRRFDFNIFGWDRMDLLATKHPFREGYCELTVLVSPRRNNEGNMWNSSHFDPHIRLSFKVRDASIHDMMFKKHKMS